VNRAVTGQLVHEQVQEAGFHRVQRWAARAQLALERRPERLSRRPGSARATSVARRPRSPGDGDSRIMRVRVTASAEQRETRAEL
jgi:hypothetical protein